ncbi:MAG TPA: hypothetical protein VMU61_09640 [Candidatus Aquilonibacter sp.]|nr:hypothetical protein [Candidatus Aquilonibacter sp.]
MLVAREEPPSNTETASSKPQLARVFSTFLDEEGAAPASERLQRLTDLLLTNPVELGSICDEIRSHPAFEALVVRMTNSLALSPDAGSTTVEEAAIQLGVDRLRILATLWSEGTLAGEAAGQPPASPKPPEAIYLAALFRSFSQSHRNAGGATGQRSFLAFPESEQRADLADVLMRDFLSLIPFLDSNQWTPPTLPSAAGSPAK